MYYSCPKCSSKKKPKLANYFPPIAVKCLDCGHMNLEVKFLNEGEHHSKTVISYSH
ncbi:MAG: hypothetical protein ACXABO_11030 [Promethearchaeota archaeon]